MTKLDLINKIKREEVAKKHEVQMDKVRELLKKNRNKEERK